MSEFMIRRKTLKQGGGDLKNSVKSRNTEQYLAEDIINILEEVTTRIKIGSSRVNLPTRFNTPWKDSVNKNQKENSNNIKYKSADAIRKCYICQSTTHLANACPRKGEIHKIDIEKEPDVEKYDVIEDNSDDKLSIFCEYSKDIENINVIFDILESYSHLPQLSNGQVDLLKIQDAQLMKTKPNRGKSEQLNEAEISLHPTDKQESELSSLLYDHKKAFASYKEPLQAIVGHEVAIIFNIERPYPPHLRRNSYPERPKSREALEVNIKELLDVGHNEEVEITTPVIVAWNNGKSRMVGDIRALNTYTVPDRYPIPKNQISLTQTSQEVYISTMDALKGLYQNVVTPLARKYLRVIVHCGAYEYFRMPFGIKNEPSHLQRMMNKIFPEECPEG
ncbi:hypothetical protein O181_039712 [Austropuccinia psidii MF-1]|uniref:CCHC-type domain-containing protein n=1 Tax=Austropuccinia psidii MF-1 TaxID=1389203 RepID=A0A9Q3DHC0_9BASI|nr:hypothetical protein [Austropuccinia psidii MF-1]